MRSPTSSRTIRIDVAKVTASFDPSALTLTVKKVPGSIASGYVKTDGQPALFEEKGLFKKYGEGVDVSPGAAFDDIAEFVVTPGMYNFEATLVLQDGDTVNDAAFQRGASCAGRSELSKTILASLVFPG
jgi:hypothetical protein